MSNIAIVHLSAVIALVMTGIHIFLMLLFIALIIVSYHWIMNDLLFNVHHIKRLRCFPDHHEWYAQDRSDNTYTILKLYQYSIFRSCLTIKLEDDIGRRHWVVIPKDSVIESEFRRLNVLLLYHQPLQHPASKNSEV